MNNYIHTHKHENSLSLTLDVGANKVYVIGEKMNKIHEMAYMNGYNWSAFLDFYLKKNTLAHFVPISLCPFFIHD